MSVLIVEENNISCAPESMEMIPTDAKFEFLSLEKNSQPSQRLEHVGSDETNTFTNLDQVYNRSPPPPDNGHEGACGPAGRTTLNRLSFREHLEDDLSFYSYLFRGNDIKLRDGVLVPIYTYNAVHREYRLSYREWGVLRKSALSGNVIAVNSINSLENDLLFHKCRDPARLYYVCGGLLGGSKRLANQQKENWNIVESLPSSLSHLKIDPNADLNKCEESEEDESSVDDDEFEDFYGLICDRSCLTYTLMSSLPDGLYYIDVQNCFSVNGVQEGYTGPVYQLTELNFYNMMENVNGSYYMTVSRGLGGNKKGTKVLRQAKNTIRKIVNTGKKIKKVADFVHEVAGSGRYKVKSNKKRSGKKKRYGDPKQFLKGLNGNGFYSSAYGVSGSGAYNTLINPTGSPMHVAHREDETGDITLEYTEYVMDIYSGGANFTNMKFPVNPGLSWFSFLSQLAEQYEQYYFDKLIFKYVPTVANVTATGQLGSVMMAFKYNASDPVFLTKQQMMGYSGAINDIISNHIFLGVECSRSKGAASSLYIRGGSVPSGQDIKTYDLGALFIGTAGVNTTSFPVGTQIGELHVMYSVKLMKPRIYATVGASVGFDTFYASSGLTVSPFNVFGPSPLKGATNIIGCEISKSGNNRITFPDNIVGYFDVWMCMFGTGFTNSFGINTNGQMSLLSTQWNGVFTNVTSNTSSTTSLLKITVSIQYPITSSGNFLTVVQNTFNAATITSMYVYITQCNPLIPVNSNMLVSA